MCISPNQKRNYNIDAEWMLSSSSENNMQTGMERAKRWTWGVCLQRLRGHRAKMNENIKWKRWIKQKSCYRRHRSRLSPSMGFRHCRRTYYSSPLLMHNAVESEQNEQTTTNCRKNELQIYAMTTATKFISIFFGFTLWRCAFVCVYSCAPWCRYCERRCERHL